MLYAYTQNGETYYQVYLHTQSQYAPNGDSGTFTFDGSGNLVSNNAAALSRIHNEAQAADPLVMVQINGIFDWFKNHWHQITGCAMVAGAAFLTGAAVVTTGGAALLAAGGLLLGGASGVFEKAAKNCG